jgi:hypothetical protein
MIKWCAVPNSEPFQDRGFNRGRRAAIGHGEDECVTQATHAQMLEDSALDLVLGAFAAMHL